MSVHLQDDNDPIKLSLTIEGTTLSMARLACPPISGDAGTIVWTNSWSELESAERILEFASRNTNQWLAWSRIAETFGEACLSGHLEGEVAKEEATLAEAAERDRIAEEAANEAAAEAKRLASLIESYIHDTKTGWYKITLQRGDSEKPFFVVSFMEKWERERFRDWFWNQTKRFHEFAARLEEVSDKALERELLLEMVQTEQRVRKAGLAVGGRRPLRFWRGDDA